MLQRRRRGGGGGEEEEEAEREKEGRMKYRDSRSLKKRNELAETERIRVEDDHLV